MFDLPILVLKAERKELNPISREPETALVMESAEQVEAFHRGSSWGGVMDSLHLFNLCHLSGLVRPGDQIVDLACGPADFLLKAALLFPQSFFTGVDLSEEMLAVARAHAKSQNITNVRFVKGDMTEAGELGLKSFDVVMSTLAVHHLPTTELFQKFRANVFSLLKKDGAVLITDFARVRSMQSIQLLADNMTARKAPAVLVEDYISSLKAAFSEKDFQTWIQANSPYEIQMQSTRITSFLAVIRTPARISFFKRRAIWNLPVWKMTFASWVDFVMLKLLCTKIFKI